MKAHDDLVCKKCGYIKSRCNMFSKNICLECKKKMMLVEK